MEAQLRRDHDDLHPSVNDSPVVRSGLVEPTVMGTPVLAEDLYWTHSDIVDPPVRSFAQWEEEERHDAPPPLSTDYGTHRTDHGPDVARVEHIEQLPVSTGYDTRVTDVPRETYDANVNRGGLLLPSGLEEERSTGYETRGATNAGGEEVIGITGVLKSFDKMKVYDEPDTKTKSLRSDQPEPNVYTGSHDQFAPEPVESPPPDTITDNPSNPNPNPNSTSSYTQRISSATSAIADKAAALKDTVVSKLSSSGENKTQGSSTVTHKTSTKSSFPTEFSHKVADTLSTTLGPIYETVTGAGGSVMSKMHDESTGVSGVRVKEYLLDRFKPGDDDKVLSEVLTQALHMGKRNQNQQPQETCTTTTYVVRDEGERRVEDSSN